MRCLSVGSGTVNRLQSRTQSATQSFTAAHMIASFACLMPTGALIETHEQAGDFKEP